jgi:chromosome partitioning protein
MGKIIGIQNQKGGTGKTATSINLAAFLQETGNVLGVDADIQGNFSDGMLTDKTIFDRDSIHTKYLMDLINDVSLKTSDAIYPVTIKTNSKDRNPKRVNIDMIPASRNEDKKLYNDPYALKKHLDLIKDDYDYIIIDFPPERPYANIGDDTSEYNLVTLALCCVDQILIPCSTDLDSLTGCFTLLEHISILKEELNPRLDNISFFINGYSGYSSERDFLDYCKALPWYSGICIPYSGLLKMSRIMYRPMAWYNNKSNLAIAYKKLADYIAKE